MPMAIRSLIKRPARTDPIVRSGAVVMALRILCLAVAAAATGWAVGDRRWWLAGAGAVVVVLVAIWLRPPLEAVQRALDRAEPEREHLVRRLTQINDLLSSLYGVTAALPTKLDLERVLDYTVAALRERVPSDGWVVFLVDEPADGEAWRAARRDGIDVPEVIDPTSWPEAATQALDTRRTVRAELIPPRVGAERNGHHNQSGFRPTARVGVYVPLTARDRIVGLIAAELDEPDESAAATGMDALEAMRVPTGLALDNARWFTRLRILGADEERVRIADDLHDRVGQTLAYLGFELERLKRTAGDAPIAEDLERLRQDLRTALGEIRETLFDLRSDVAEDVDVATALSRCCDRVRERSGLHVAFLADGEGRLPLRQEHEMWRIGQEVILAAERQWGASAIEVRWWRDGHAAEVTVAHDGPGMIGGRRRGDGAELVSLRDRADSLGAIFATQQTEDGRTELRCRFDPQLAGL